MRTALLIIIALFIFSCNLDSSEEREEMLTSVNWTMEQDLLPSGEVLNHKTIYNFKSDGTYLLVAGEIEVNGKWTWISGDEILLEIKGLTFNDEETQFDAKSNNYYIRVIELSEKVFKTLERHERDDWNSEFVKEVNYIPMEL